MIAIGYVLFGALRVNPLASKYRVTVELPDSGGLLPNQDVTVRGIPDRAGRIPDHYPVRGRRGRCIESSGSSPPPARCTCRGCPRPVSSTSTSLPNTGRPFPEGRQQIPLGSATVPVTLAEMLASADGTLKQVDTAKLEILKKELSMTDKGPQKLADIVDGGTFMLATLDSVLPETTSLLRSSKVTLEMVADKNAGIDVASDNLSRSFVGIGKMQNGFRTLTEQTPTALSRVDNLFTDNSDTMVQLLGSLATTSQLLYLRVPALHALFPDYRTSVFDAIGSTMHDNGLWATGEHTRDTRATTERRDAHRRRRTTRAVHVHVLPRRRSGGPDPRSQECAPARRGRHRGTAARRRPRSARPTRPPRAGIRFPLRTAVLFYPSNPRTDLECRHFARR